MRTLLRVLAVAVAGGLVLSLTACGSDQPVADSVYANQGVTIGIAMPNKTSTRWIADGNAMVSQFTAMGYKVDLRYADDVVDQQAGQIETMIRNGDRLLVVTAVDSGALTKVLGEAAARKIPVIAYDRLLTGTDDVDYQATFDNHRVGVLQAQLLVDRLGLTKKGTGPFNVELFAGAATDSNARLFHSGSMEILRPYIDAGRIRVPSGETDFSQVATENWDADVAKARMRRLLKNDYSAGRRVDAVLSPFDGMTIGIIDALKGAGYGTRDQPLPFTSGQDAQLASVKSIIAGEQTGTIFKDTRELAKVAVQQGNALLTGSAPMVNDTVSYNNGVRTVPTYLLYPVAVDKTNYRTLLVDSGYLKASDLS